MSTENLPAKAPEAGVGHLSAEARMDLQRQALGNDMPGERDGIPLVTIHQPTSPDIVDAERGEFVMPLTGESLGPVIRFVPLARYHTRAFWRNREDEAPECASIDGLRPRDGAGPADAGAKEICAACPFAAWTTEPGNPKARVPPKCTLAINWFGFTYDKKGERRKSRMSFKRTAFQAGETIGKSVKATSPPLMPHELQFELTTEAVQRTKTEKFFKPKLRVVGRTKDLDPEVLVECERGLAEWVERKDELQHAALAEQSAKLEEKDPAF